MGQIKMKQAKNIDPMVRDLGAKFYDELLSMIIREGEIMRSGGIDDYTIINIILSILASTMVATAEAVGMNAKRTKEYIDAAMANKKARR